MYETIERKGNIEYFLNADGKKVMRYADETIGYRVDEIKPELQIVLDKARARYNYPYKETIDTALFYQQYSTLKAVRYIKWRLLGECNYLDVYGAEAERDYSMARHQELLEHSNERIDELHAKIDYLQKQVDVLTKMVENQNKPEVKKRKSKNNIDISLPSFV